jgi:Mrp family chromosome partitioning ATPase
MSKNFELLQNLGKEHDMFATGVATAAPPVSQLVEVAPLQLEMYESQRDELGKLVLRLFLQPETERSRCVMFAATEPGNGCSWTCARAAEILASQVAGSVCLVDANLRSPGLHQQFGVENLLGLADSMRLPDSIRHFIRPLNRNNLWILSSGHEASSGQVRLSSDRVHSRIAELRAQFDYVLIDAPPLSSGNEGITLARAVDGIVLVLKANSSRRETTRETVQEMNNAQVKVLGAVLNQRTFPIPATIYDRL